MRKIARIAVPAVVLPLLAVAVYLGYMTVTDFRPAAEMGLEVKNNSAAMLERNVPFTLLTFNIGYAGMDAGADFFMDGGRGSRGSSLKQTRVNLQAIGAFLSATDPDLALLQEVDLRATRSYRLDERRELQSRLPGHGSIFAVNYKVPWVPVPLTRPMGAVHGGLLTMSRFHVRAAFRRRLPGSEGWPRQLAELDRCLAECRLPLRGGGELVLMHLHLSAFDRGGRIRSRQLAFLRERLQEEYRQDNHVIAGGDWNHGLPGSSPGRFESTMKRPDWYLELPAGFAPAGFSWVLDPSRPTIRASSTPYRPGESFVAVIDGFLVSDNVEVRRTAGHDLGFAHSDHHPVLAVLALR
jgi:endonuclease/exonuclease/phosphatase family metal-dependent hydrolase